MKLRAYTPKEKEKIKTFLCELLDKSFEVNKHGNSPPLWMSLAFILEKFNTGNFYGTISIKVIGTSVNDAKEVDRTHKLVEYYDEIL